MTSDNSVPLTSFWSFILIYKLTSSTWKRWHDCKTSTVVSASPIFSPFWSKSELLQEEELYICISGLPDQTLPLEIMLRWWNKSQQVFFFQGSFLTRYVWVTQYTRYSLITWIPVFLTNIVLCWPMVENMPWSVPSALLIMFIRQLVTNTDLSRPLMYANYAYDFICFSKVPHLLKKHHFWQSWKWCFSTVMM